MKTHNIKIDIDYADRVVSGEKTFEVRINDRGYQKGDTVKFEAFYRSGLPDRSHPINNQEYQITYVHSGLGLQNNYVVFAIKPIPANP